MRKGFVYIFSNPSFQENLYKIGRTHSIEERLKGLHKTGTPSPFKVEYSREFNDCVAAEKSIHTLLSSYRYAKNREFFKINLTEAISAIDKYALKELEQNVSLIQERLDREKECSNKLQRALDYTASKLEYQAEQQHELAKDFPYFLVTWAHIPDPEHIFSVWADNKAELEWARQAWEYIIDYGLAKYTYGNKSEYTIILIRFITLNIMYEEFCCKAGFQSLDEIDLMTKVDQLELDESIIESLISNEIIENEFSSEKIEFHGYCALKLLILSMQERDNIYKAISKGFEHELFCSLLYTCMDFDSENLDEFTLLELAEPGTPTGDAFMWIMDGMPEHFI